MLQFLEFRVHYAKRVEEESHRMQELVKHEPSILDKVLGKLEALLPQQGHQQHGEGAEAANANATSEPEVHSFKFEEFTGEAPPHPKESDGPSADPLEQIAKRNSVRMTAHTTAPDFGGDEFIPPPPPPMFSAQFETADGLSKRSSSEFFVPPPPPPPQFGTSPSAPTSPSSMPMTPWDDMGSISVPVAVPVFNQGLEQQQQQIPSWPPASSNNAFSSPMISNTMTMTQESGDSHRPSSSRSSFTTTPANGTYQFPTDFHSLHTNAMGPSAGVGMGGANAPTYPHF